MYKRQDPDILAGDRIQQLNKWPSQLPGWRETLVAYFEAIHGVSENLLRAFALALEMEEEYLKYISMRCWIDPREVGDLAVFLASEKAKHITGQFIAVDGHMEWEA